MSTRSCIARLTSNPGKKIKFKGVYHHWDGYPQGLGSTLFQLRNGHFKGDTNAMLKVLIDQHPAGWSNINNADFSLVPGYMELNTKHDFKDEDYQKTPHCFCHGERSEPGCKINQKNASNSGCEYVYAFTPNGKTMVVLSSYCEDGKKMIGMFGCGDPKAEWKVIGEVNLDGTEPTEEGWGEVPIQQAVMVPAAPEPVEEPLDHNLAELLE